MMENSNDSTETSDLSAPSTKLLLSLYAHRAGELTRSIKHLASGRDAVIAAAEEAFRTGSAGYVAERKELMNRIAELVQSDEVWLELSDGKKTGEVVIEHLRLFRRKKSQPVVVFPEGEDVVKQRAMKVRRRFKYGLFTRKVTITFNPKAFLKHPRLAKRLGVSLKRMDDLKIDVTPVTKEGTGQPKPVHSVSLQVPPIAG